MKAKDLIIENSKLVNGDENAEINHFTINTDIVEKNSIFIPLKGKRDGHDFVLNNIDKFKGFICDKEHKDIITKAKKLKDDIIIIETDDNLKYMQKLAEKRRNEITVPVIALTGSYGKTSQKEMLYSVLKTKFNVLCTKGNFNNHIGMPLTLLNYNDEDVVLLELGSNHMGEIEFLRNICKPTITTITCIGTAHIGNFKSLRNTFKEKTSIVKNSKYFIQNMDDKFLKKFKSKNSVKFGLDYDNITNIIHGKKTRYTISVNGKPYKITINSNLSFLIGYSICAIKIGLLLNMDMKDIIKGIAAYKCPEGRMETIEKDGYVTINDCYNASYETMTSGLSYFFKQKYKNKVVVIGDILELGRKSKKIHKAIGTYIITNNLKFKEIYLVGKEMHNVYKMLKKFGFNVFYYDDVTKLNPEVLKDKSVYLKASHSMNLESLIKQ